MSRELIAQSAEESEGYGYGADKEQYCTWLYPHDTLADALQMGKDQWSCGLEGLAVMREGRVDAPELLRPYHGSNMAVAWLQTIADRSGAKMSMNRAQGEFYPPERGDILYVGETPGYGGAGHVRCIVKRNGFSYESIDGGQVDSKGNKCIKRRLWTLEKVTDGNWWSRDTDGAHSPQQPGTGRRCNWYVNGDLLPFLPLSTLAGLVRLGTGG